MKEEILKSRESKSKALKRLLLKDENVVILTLKANIPGIDKDTISSRILMKYFNTMILNKYPNSLTHSFNGADGFEMWYLMYGKDPVNLKEEMVKIEEEHELGRFIDLDVHESKSYKSMNRTKLRKCFICDQPAFVCGRNKIHTIEELNEFIDINVFSYLRKLVRNIIYSSIMKELNLHPKFGLVTPYTNGSHKDMNYDLMKKSIDGFIDELIFMFYKGLNCSECLENDFKDIRKLGLKAEEKMLGLTNGVNTYKGLIFDLGIICYAVGNYIKTDRPIKEIIKELTKGITSELKEKYASIGESCLEKYHIRGARYEAEQGFPHVFKIAKKYDLDNESELLTSLCELIGNVEDTVLFKRCRGIRQYRLVRKHFRCLDVLNKNEIEEFNNYCINQNLSFGGAADLLICSCFVQEFDKFIKLKI